MGDTCYLKFSIYGSIDTLEVLDEIATAIRAERAIDEAHGRNLNDNDDVLLYLATIPAGKEGPRFYIDECNYADIGDLERVLQRYEVAYAVDHDRGSDYEGGCWSWKPGREIVRCGNNDDGPYVYLYELEQAMQAPNPDEAIYQIIADLKIANGSDMPAWEPTGEAKMELARLLALEVIDAK